MEQSRMTRRSFLKQSSVGIGASAVACSSLPVNAFSNRKPNRPNLNSKTTSFGFHGMLNIPKANVYAAGKGKRIYSPHLNRFHSPDGHSYSPFGAAGVNGYAFVNGDPVNQRDPSGHLGFISLIIGAVVGSIVGAALSASAEAIKCSLSGESFDWKSVAKGAAFGMISGGLGVAATGASTAGKLGLAIVDAGVQTLGGLADSFNEGVRGGELATSVMLGIGSSIVTFFSGYGATKIRSLSKRRNRARINISGNSPIDIEMTTFGVSLAEDAVTPGPSSAVDLLSTNKVPGVGQSPLENLIAQTPWRSQLVGYLDSQSLANLAQSSSTMNRHLDLNLDRRFYRQRIRVLESRMDNMGTKLHNLGQINPRSSRDQRRITKKFDKLRIDWNNLVIRRQRIIDKWLTTFGDAPEFRRYGPFPYVDTP